MKLALVFLLLTIVAVTWAEYEVTTEEPITEEPTTEVYWTTYADDLDVGIPDRWAEKRKRDQGEAGGQGRGRGGRGGSRGGRGGGRGGDRGNRGGPRGPRPTTPDSAFVEE